MLGWGVGDFFRLYALLVFIELRMEDIFFFENIKVFSEIYIEIGDIF